MNPLIRPAVYEDCESIATIYNEYLGKSTMDLEVKTGEYYVDFLRNKSDLEELWLMGITETICWGVIKKYSDRYGYRFTGETSVYCRPDMVGKGFGKKMKIHLMERCRSLGYHHLIARIFSTNEVSINYNLKLGYTIVGIQNEIGKIDGKWQDVTVMQCIL